MSKRRITVKSKKADRFYFALGVVASLLFVGFTNVKESTSHRGIASLNPGFHKGFELHQKIKPPISVEIQKEGFEKVFANDEFTVKAIVKTSAPTQRVEVKWSLPEYVSLLAGEKQLIITDLKVGEERELELRLKSHSEENQQIHINATGEYSSSRLSAVDQINTLLEDDLRAAKERLVERNREYIQKTER